MECAEYRDLVAAHVDHQLARAEETLAAAHVARCTSCAALLTTQRALKAALRGPGIVARTPEGVRQALVAQIDAAERAQAASSWWRRARPSLLPRFAVAAVAVLVLGAVVTWVMRSRHQAPAVPLFAGIVADYQAVEAGKIALDVYTDDPMQLRTYYLQSGAFTFRNTVVNLEPLGLPLVGGSITELAGTKSTLSVYRDDHWTVLCHRIQLGSVMLPSGGEVVAGDRYFTVDGITICVHLEGDVICFMASAMPRADFMRRLALGHA